jgi:transposase InsO family protein
MTGRLGTLTQRAVFSKWLEQWERPAHDWGDKTAWRLFNATTFALAGKVVERPDLTKQLHTIYLATVMDLYSRKIVGWAMADHLPADLPLAALRWPLQHSGLVPA